MVSYPLAPNPVHILLTSYYDYNSHICVLINQYYTQTQTFDTTRYHL